MPFDKCNKDSLPDFRSYLALIEGILDDHCGITEKFVL